MQKPERTQVCIAQGCNKDVPWQQYILVCLFMLAQIGCSTPNPVLGIRAYNAYPGYEKPPSMVAVVCYDPAFIDIVQVDDQPVRIERKPGRQLIEIHVIPGKRVLWCSFDNARATTKIANALKEPSIDQRFNTQILVAARLFDLAKAGQLVRMEARSGCRYYLYPNARGELMVGPVANTESAADTTPTAPTAVPLAVPPVPESAPEMSRAASAHEKDMTVDLGGGVLVEFVWIEALKGWVGKYEVTNEEYQQFNPNHDSGAYKTGWRIFSAGDERHGMLLNARRQPVVNVSYEDAANFAGWMNQLTNGLPAGYRARLPEKLEWMMFAMCGQIRTYPWGDDWPPTYGNYGYPKNVEKGRFGKHDGVDGSAVSCWVEESGRNEWGLYGVGGNVWEWTNEETKGEMACRGASWFYYHRAPLRCGNKYMLKPDVRNPTVGFRLVVLR